MVVGTQKGVTLLLWNSARVLHNKYTVDYETKDQERTGDSGYDPAGFSLVTGLYALVSHLSGWHVYCSFLGQGMELFAKGARA